MDELNATVARLEERGKSNTRRIDALERDTEAINKLATSVEVMATNMEVMAKEQKAQGERLSKLEAEPAERWNIMTRTIFTAIISTCAGALITFLFTMLMGGF